MNILDLVQAAGAIPPVQAPAPSNGPDIVVTPKPERKVAEDDRVAPSEYTNPEIVPRHGLFGIKGTLRDVLGTLGDSFLIGSGRQAIYRPVREQEKLGNAIYQYNQDPVAAIDRAAMVNPEAAMDLQKQYDQGRRYDATIAAQKIAGQQKAASVLGSWSRAVTPESYGMAREKMQAYSDQNGLGYDFPADYDKDYMAGVFTRGMTPDQISDDDRAAAQVTSMQDYRNQQIAVARSRVEQAREAAAARTAVAQRNAGTASQRAAEDARHNRVSEATDKYKAEHPASRGKPSILDQLRGGNPNIPPPPGGTIRKIK